jgi:hypothetical protein
VPAELPVIWTFSESAVLAGALSIMTPPVVAESVVIDSPVDLKPPPLM